MEKIHFLFIFNIPLWRTHMWLELDADTGIPLRRQIYERIKTLILHGDLKAEEKLPSSRGLAKDLGIARQTVLDVYEQLLAEGYLAARPGSGTRVAQGIAPTASLSGTPAGFMGQKWQRADVSRPDEVNFRSGIPALDKFPQEEWGRLYRHVCRSLPAAAFRYCGPGGIWELREAITAYLFRMRGIRVPPERVMITSGSTQGLRIVARLLRRNSSAVLVEDPAHRGLLEVVVRAGYTVEGLRADERGLDTSALRTLSRERAGRVAFAYVTPSHQYPLGGILPVQRRQALIGFARDAGCHIVEDDYDSEFRYEGAPVSSLYELAPETVIYLGSFSKIMAPALRLGFAIVPDALRAAWEPEKMYTDVHTDALSQYTLAAFISSGGLERHIRKMKKLYQRKRAHLLQSLARHFGSRFEVRGQAAGLHLVAAFPDVVFTEELLAALRARGVRAVPVEDYSLCRDGAHAHELVLGYSHLSEEDLDKGVALLKEALAAHWRLSSA